MNHLLYEEIVCVFYVPELIKTDIAIRFSWKGLRLYERYLIQMNLINMYRLGQSGDVALEASLFKSIIPPEMNLNSLYSC